MINERLFEIITNGPLDDIFKQVVDLIGQQTPETNRKLIEDEQSMDLLSTVISGFDGQTRQEKAHELVCSFPLEDNLQLVAYDYLAKAVGLKVSVQ